MSKQIINDSQNFVGAQNQFERDLPIYDDGYGTIFILRNSMGIQALVRAASWEDAWSICEDSFFPDCEETEEELIKEYGSAYWDSGSFQENYGYRNNVGDNGKTHHLYQKDLNGDHLDPLTPELAEELELRLVIQPEDRAEDLLGVKEDIKAAHDSLFSARWSVLQVEVSTSEKLDLLEALNDIEKQIAELRNNLATSK